MVKPDDLSEAIPSGGGTSNPVDLTRTQAASLVLASGIGISTTLSSFAFFAASPVSVPSNQIHFLTRHDLS